VKGPKGKSPPSHAPLGNAYERKALSQGVVVKRRVLLAAVSGWCGNGHPPREGRYVMLDLGIEKVGWCAFSSVFRTQCPVWCFPGTTTLWDRGAGRASARSPTLIDKIRKGVAWARFRGRDRNGRSSFPRHDAAGPWAVDPRLRFASFTPHGYSFPRGVSAKASPQVSEVSRHYGKLSDFHIFNSRRQQH
jgi:hypothetical protein